MANVKFSRKEFENEVSLDDKMIEKINMFGTPLESLNEEEIEIEIFPNRPDLLSLQGYLRSFKTFIGKEKGIKKYKINKSEKNFKVIIDKSVKNVRPYTMCAIIKSLNLDDGKIKQIIDLQEKLHTTLGRNRKKLAIGIYPLDKINLPITYKALNPKEIIFKPLESVKEMSAIEILKKHPAGKEYSHLMENLEKFPIFIDSKKKILSMPPIINSEETGRITEKTKDIFVECSGHHLESLKKTLNIIVSVLADLGGKIYSMDLEYKDKKISSPEFKEDTLKISLENTNKLLGLTLKEKDLEKLLPKMGFEYSQGKVKVPPWRVDILHEVDIIEDIGIAYGYENLIPEMPKLATIGEENFKDKINRKISEILIGLKYIEISSYHLIKKDEIPTNDLEKVLEIQNSKTEYKYLRPNLTIPLLRTISENKDNEYPQNLFEIGKVFSLNLESETGITEKEKLGIILTPGNSTEIKQVLDTLSRSLGFQYNLEEKRIQGLIEGRSAELIVNSKKIGYFGEINPDNLRKWGIKMPASILEIDLEPIYEIIKSQP